MTNIGVQRKRSRSIENEFEEFFPLSKRINNLELTFSQIIINNNNNNLHSKDLTHSENDFQSHHHQQQQQHAAQSTYCPELNVEQNPHYYFKNNILYDLYLERMRRSEFIKSDH